MTKRAALLLLPLSLLLSCRNDMREVAKLNAKLPTEDRATDVTIIYSKAGKVEARLTAKEFIRAERAKPPYTDARKGVKMEFFDSTLHLTSTVTAKYARWYEGKGNVLLRDAVRVKNDKGEELRTEELVWNQAVAKFYTEKPVQIVTPTQTLAGMGLEANQNFTWHRITSIKGSVKVDKGAVPTD